MTQIIEGTEISPWDRYFLGVDHDVDSWILQGCLEICGSVESYPPELLSKFANRNATVNLSKLLKIRQEYRSKLLIYCRGRSRHPYIAERSYISPVCGDCLPKLKMLLSNALSPEKHVKISNENASKYPLLRDYLLGAFRPGSKSLMAVCADCRGKEGTILERVLGSSELEKEVKRMGLGRKLGVPGYLIRASRFKK